MGCDGAVGDQRGRGADMTRDPLRLEARTPNTTDCPDARHEHRWVKRRPELTLGEDRRLAYDAAADGTVVISEEALSRLLRMAGFVPSPAPGERPWPAPPPPPPRPELLPDPVVPTNG